MPSRTAAGPIPQQIAPADVVSDGERHRLLSAAYRDHQAGLARHILALTGDPGSVEDLVNETFIRAFEGLERFEGRAGLDAWLRGIARNLARAHVAKRRRRRRLDALVDVSSARPEPSPEAHLRERQAAARLYAALDSLSDELREAFVVCVLDRRSLAQASTVLGVPVSTLHARKQRAEQALRRQLGGPHQEGDP